MRLTKLIGYFFQLLLSRLKKESVVEIIFRAVSDVGGIYIKLIQFVCLRTDVFSESDKLRFLSFYDNAQIETLNVYRIVKDELGTAGFNRFSAIDTKPLAAGTFGQVYRAKLVDGTEVILKIKRAGLIQKLQYDFLILRVFSYLLDLIFEQKIINLQKTLTEFEQSTHHELDYLKEARNAQYFYSVYQEHPRVFIPRTYIDLCTPNILVQDYVEGISVADLIRENIKYPGKYRDWLKQHYSTDPLYIYPSIAYDLAIQGFTQQLFYADPHPGNIKILPNNRYALIDFGIVGTPPENRTHFYKMISILAQQADDMDMKRIGSLFLEWGAGEFYNKIEVFDDYFSQGPQSLREFVLQKYTKALERNRGKFRSVESENREDFAQMFIDIISSGSDLKVKIPEGMLVTLKSMIIFKTWVSYLEPHYHFMRNTYKRILTDVKETEIINKSKTTSRVTPESALETVLEWLENVAESDLPAYRKIDDQLTPHLYA